MKKLIPVYLVIGLVVAVISYFASSLPKKSKYEQAFKTGVVAPLSGENANVGLNIVKGVKLAKKEMNADYIEILTAVASGKKSLKSHRVEYGVDPGLFAAQSYDALKSLSVFD